MTEPVQHTTPNRPHIAERCPVCGGLRTLQELAGDDKAVCQGTPECLAQLLEEVKAARPWAMTSTLRKEQTGFPSPCCGNAGTLA